MEKIVKNISFGTDLGESLKKPKTFFKGKSKKAKKQMNKRIE